MSVACFVLFFTKQCFCFRINRDTKEPEVYIDEMILQSVPESLKTITSLLHQKDLSGFVPDTVPDIREVLDFCPGSETDMLEIFEKTLTKEDLSILEEETEKFKNEFKNMR